MDNSRIDSSTSSMPPSPAPTAAASWRPTGWSDLPTDWLGCISSFLSLKCLSSSFLPVCRGWRDGVHSAAPREEWLTISSERIMRLCHTSIDVGRHATKLRTTDALSDESLALIRRLPRLTELECGIDCRGDSMATATEVMMQQQLLFEFPTQLTTLKLTFAMAVDYDMFPSWIQLERMLDAVAEVSTLTSLDVMLDVDGTLMPIPVRTMQPLARLRDSLTRLNISRPLNGEVTAAGLSRAHIHLLRLLRSLHRLKSLTLRGIAGWSVQSLEWLAEEPRMTHLQGMDLGDTIISAAHSAVLARFPWLTSLSVRLGDPIFLAHLTQLTSVTLACWHQGDPMLLLAALSHCTRIEKMVLVHPGITSAHLCVLIADLPLLAELSLASMPSLTSLAFASSVGHLARTLRCLTLCMCSALSSREVRHLRALTALRGLTLVSSFRPPLDDDTIASMTPTSPTFERGVWPHLIQFHCTPSSRR